MFTTPHYYFLYSILSDLIDDLLEQDLVKPEQTELVRDCILEVFASRLKEDNPKFKVHLFRKELERSTRPFIT